MEQEFNKLKDEFNELSETVRQMQHFTESLLDRIQSLEELCGRLKESKKDI